MIPLAPPALPTSLFLQEPQQFVSAVRASICSPQVSLHSSPKSALVKILIRKNLLFLSVSPLLPSQNISLLILLATNCVAFSSPIPSNSVTPVGCPPI